MAKQHLEGFIPNDDNNNEQQPQAQYPDMPEEDVSKLCRACNDGYGDGCCSYHAHQFRIDIKKAKMHLYGW